MIDKASIEHLKQRADIVDVISRYVQVRKQGANFVCVCPFHDDKNPSMSINSLKGFYHCYACNAGGDVFKFVQDYEKLGFQEAVEKVAAWNNFALSYTKEKQNNSKSLKHILPCLNALYKQNLAKNKQALTYLYERGLDDEDIRHFELGFALSSEESLRLLKNEQIDLQDALEVGAIKQDMSRQGEYYASFIQRITFPIYDHKGLLVGFGGRTLDTNNMAKYVNSPQNKLFDKSRIFYAFNLAKDEIIKQQQIIICEGYMDAIAFHKAGIKNAVAVLGTALTEHHLPLIKRFEAKVVLCFDNDKAGINAATRSAFLLSINKIDGKVIILEGGKDPADLVSSHQEAKLFELLERGMELGEFYIRRLLDNLSLQSALDKQKALEKIQSFTFALDPLVAQSYVALVALLLGVDQSFVVLSKNLRQNFVSKAKKDIHLDKNDIAELELIAYLCQHKEARTEFESLSSPSFFKHFDDLMMSLRIGEFEQDLLKSDKLSRVKPLQNKEEFLRVLISVFLNFSRNNLEKNSLNAYKIQLLHALQSKFELIKKSFTQSSDFEFFLTQSLIFLKKSPSEEQLSKVLQNFQAHHFVLDDEEDIF